jgi:hypothetical protein
MQIFSMFVWLQVFFLMKPLPFQKHALTTLENATSCTTLISLFVHAVALICMQRESASCTLAIWRLCCEQLPAARRMQSAASAEQASGPLVV